MSDLIERLRSSAKAFRENTVYTSDGDAILLGVQAEECEQAADRVAALEAENVRLREALTTILDHGYVSEYIKEERHDYLIARQALAQQGSEL